MKLVHKTNRRLSVFHLHLPFAGPDAQKAVDSQKHRRQLLGPS